MRLAFWLPPKCEWCRERIPDPNERWTFYGLGLDRHTTHTRCLSAFAEARKR